MVLAYEALRSQPSLLRRSPWLAAFGFGLLHGFGFAGALRDIGLPTEDLWVALLSFNIGIELGQLLMIGLWMLVIKLISHTGAARAIPPLTTAVAYGIGGVAMFWTLQRAIPIVVSSV